MLAKLFYFLLGLSNPELEERSSIEVVDKRTFPELEHIQFGMQKKMNKTMADLEVFCTIVECLNEGLEDVRLESFSGTMMALKQLQEYGTLTKRPQVIVVNKAISKSEKMPALFFEV